MNKKIIALAIALVLIVAVPLSVYAAADHQWYTFYTYKEFHCDNCGNTWTVTVQNTVYMVHGQITGSFSMTNPVCPICGLPVQFDQPMIKPSTIPGAKSEFDH